MDIKEQNGTLLSFAYSQTIVLLLPNDHSPLPKRLCACAQFETLQF